MVDLLADDEVLRRYDAYLQQFVEPLNICPFARRARQHNTLARSVLRGDPSIPQVVEALQHLTAPPASALDVAVLILPDVAVDASPFMRFVSRVRETFTRQSNPPHGYFLVAMHPLHTMDLSSPERAVAFMRRTPHPSIQVARASVIMEARGVEVPGQESVSDRVARLGLEAVLHLGAAESEALLTRIRNGL